MGILYSLYVDLLMYAAISFFSAYFIVHSTCRFVREKLGKTLDIGNENIAVIIVSVCLFIVLSLI